jgi:hypothetical protein
LLLYDDQMRRNFYNETLNEEFRESCYLWAEGLRVTPNALFMFAAQFGKGKSWIKERYYGGVKAKRSDIAWVQLHTIGAENIVSALHEGNQKEMENKYKLSVSNMCRACTRMETTPGCPDSSCPLRPVSPLPLRGA